MESAFGVDHGDVSKGLPRALRGKVANPAAQSRKAANTYGNDFGRMKSAGFIDERTLAQGKNQKALVRRASIKNNNRSKSRELP